MYLSNCESCEPPFTALEAEALSIVIEKKIKGTTEETTKHTINLRNVFTMLEEAGQIRKEDVEYIIKELHKKKNA